MNNEVLDKLRTFIKSNSASDVIPVANLERVSGLDEEQLYPYLNKLIGANKEFPEYKISEKMGYITAIEKLNRPNRPAPQQTFSHAVQKTDNASNKFATAFKILGWLCILLYVFSICYAIATICEFAETLEETKDAISSSTSTPTNAPDDSKIQASIIFGFILDVIKPIILYIGPAIVCFFVSHKIKNQNK